MQFLIVAVIVLPLLPHRSMGPYDAIDPFQVGLMVVTIAGLSFVGYVASRWLGPTRGLLFGAALGGLGVVDGGDDVVRARAAREPEIVATAAGAIGIAARDGRARRGADRDRSIPALLGSLIGPLAATAAGCAIGTVLVARRHRRSETAPGAGPAAAAAVPLDNPFELGSAFKVGLLFGGVTLAT